MRDRGDYLLTGLRFPEARTAFAAAMAKGETDVAAKVRQSMPRAASGCVCVWLCVVVDGRS